MPDVENGANAQISEINVTVLSDIIVTFTPIIRNIVVPSGFTDNFCITYQVGNSSINNANQYEPEYTWISADDSETLTDIFHIYIQDMGFDLEACFTGDTPVMSMKSGRCVGREFEIMENIQKVTYSGKKGYMLTLKRAQDSSLNTYYPSQNDPLAAGDYFVLLNINMPDVFIKAAEVRLLRAATQYLADNCETQFTYQPSIDDIYLQRNYDKMVKAGTPEASVFWRLYAGLKFMFRGVPSSADAPAPLADITIEKVTISMGEGLTPKVELTLNDDVLQNVSEEKQAEHIVSQMLESKMEKHRAQQTPVLSLENQRRVDRAMVNHKPRIGRISDDLKHREDRDIDNDHGETDPAPAFQKIKCVAHFPLHLFPDSSLPSTTISLHTRRNPGHPPPRHP